MIYNNFVSIVEKKYGKGFEFEPWFGEISSNSKIKGVCPTHGPFEQILRYFTYYDYGCPHCKDECVSNKKYDNFIIKANKVHNNKYTYDKFNFKNVRQKIKIACPIHGDFEQTIANHLSNCGCPICGEIDRVNSLNVLTVDDAVKNFKLIHGDFYDYSLVEYKGSRIPVNIICPIHGIFTQYIHNHVRGSGCQECAKIKNGAATQARFGYSYDNLVETFNTVHDNKYHYPTFQYKKMTQKIEIICPTHGSFKQAIASHKNGSGCPNCWYCYNVSKIETDWLDSLCLPIKRGIRITINNKQLRPDGYCEDTNTIYLFHGSYWHGDPRVYSSDFKNKNNKQTMGELYETTLLHEKIYKDNGYNLVVMWEYDWIMLNKKSG